MARFMITIATPAFKDGVLNGPIETSVRESRAKRHARKLRNDGYKSVMLFKLSAGQWLPIGFKANGNKPHFQSVDGCNSTRILMPLEGKELKEARERAPGRRGGGLRDWARRHNG